MCLADQNTCLVDSIFESKQLSDLVWRQKPAVFAPATLDLFDGELVTSKCEGIINNAELLPIKLANDATDAIGDLFQLSK